MPLVLQPQNSFTVVRQIANHLDAGTYYVQAVIRNAYTDVILATLDLEDKTEQRFKKNWRVPADASGQGFYISIVTSVYIDSNYINKSENYGDEENTYLVQERVLNKIGGGHGGLGMRDVRRIMGEVLDERKPEKIVFPKPEQIVMRWDEILKAIKIVGDKIKPQEKVKFDSVIKEIKEVKKATDDKEVTTVNDLIPIITRINDNKEEHISEFLRLEEMFNKMLGEIIDVQKLKNIITVIQPPAPIIKEVKEEKQPININKLST